MKMESSRNLEKWDYRDVILYSGDIFDCLKDLPKGEIQAVITSPTYWGKRQYTNDEREFGCESLEKYVERNVQLYSSILDLMKDDGSLFVIMQDSYMGSGVSRAHHYHWENIKNPSYKRRGIDSLSQGNVSAVTAHHPIIKNKSLCGIPYRIAIKLVDMRYIWREQIIWEKPNPMPENITDRIRQSCEYILHFTKNGKYKFNPEPFMKQGVSGRKRIDNQVWVYSPEHNNILSAVFPKEIVRRLLLAVTDPNDLFFDPFLGSGTTLKLCLEHRRRFIGCDICKNFVEEAKRTVMNMENAKA